MSEGSRNRLQRETARQNLLMSPGASGSVPEYVGLIFEGTPPLHVFRAGDAHIELPAVMGGSVDAPALNLPLLYTVKRTGETLDLSRATVQRLIASGDLESVVVGKRGRRVLRSSIEQFVARLQQS